MSDRSAQNLRTGLASLNSAARELGTTLHDPFATLSFMALEVIPSLKLTDQGLIDVDQFRPVALWV